MSWYEDRRREPCPTARCPSIWHQQRGGV